MLAIEFFLPRCDGHIDLEGSMFLQTLRLLGHGFQTFFACWLPSPGGTDPLKISLGTVLRQGARPVDARHGTITISVPVTIWADCQTLLSKPPSIPWLLDAWLGTRPSSLHVREVLKGSFLTAMAWAVDVTR